MNKDLAGGVLLLAFAGAYLWAAEGIPDSTLDDAIGPRGLPVILAALLAFLALVLVVRALFGMRRAKAADAPANDEEADEGDYASPLPRALLFLLIGAGYVALLPVLGYAVAVALLIAAIAFFEGAPRDWRLPAAAAFGGGLYWLIFNALLGVGQPSGLLF